MTPELSTRGNLHQLQAMRHEKTEVCSVHMLQLRERVRLVEDFEHEVFFVADP